MAKSLQDSDISVIADEIIKQHRDEDIKGKTPLASVTYLLQLVAHDIVPATKKKHLDRRIDEISPYLNLDSIYGNSEDELIRREITNKAGFFNYARDINIAYPYGFDFDRTQDAERKETAQYLAKTPEPRNDVNVIVSQFTVLWMRLHNTLLRNRVAKDFVQAKEYVIKTFQLVCIEFALKQVCHKNVYDYYFGQVQHPALQVDLSLGIPKFFSHASFRFGHSMVREEYFFAPHRKGMRANSVITEKIFQNHNKIPLNRFVNFETFLTRIPGHMRAKNIDTQIVLGMASIDEQTAEMDSLINIAKRNLEASRDKGLHTGQCWHKVLAKQFKTLDFGAILTGRELIPTQIPAKYFNWLPLWLYILAEAEVREGGTNLGMVGSVLNCEVLCASIAGSPISVYELGKYDYAQAASTMGEWGGYLLNVQSGLGDQYENVMHGVYQWIVDNQG
ncbi:MAG: peroxidase family protein [Pseudomonadota bacterium]